MDLRSFQNITVLLTSQLSYPFKESTDQFVSLRKKGYF